MHDIAEHSAQQKNLSVNSECTFTHSVFQIIYFLVATLYISLSMNLPVSLYTGAVHDDALFITNAIGILNGDWLGSFSQMTLAKGPAYSIFLAANSLLGIPITLSISLLYLLSCWVFVGTLSKFGVNKILAFVLFIVLLFQPALFPTRIIRDNIYFSLTLLVISGFLSLHLQQKNFTSRIQTILLGLALGVFWLTREEGIWIVPAGMFFIGYKLITRKQSQIDIRLFLQHIATYVIAAVIPFLVISSANYSKYGSFEAVDFKSKSFTNALEKLNSVSVGPDIPYIPVPKAKRELIYSISPAFRQLESYFEETGKGWTQFGCQIYPQTCGDYAGGWFLWALRDAVASKGYYSTAQNAGNFYNTISSEIELACKTGKVKCNSNPIPFSPIITIESIRQIPEAVFHAIKLSLYQGSVPSTGGDSEGPLGQLNKIRLFLGNPKTTYAPNEQISLAGWYHSPKNSWIFLDCARNGKPIRISIERQDSPDIAIHFKDKNANYQRFSFDIKKSDACKIGESDQKTPLLSIEEVIKNEHSTVFLSDGSLHFDHIATVNVNLWAVKTKEQLSRFYRIITPLIAFAGMVCFIAYLLAAIVKRIGFVEIFWVSAMLWMLYLSRIALVVLVDVSSFPAINILYLAPAFPILFAASLTSFALMQKDINELSKLILKKIKYEA